MTGDDSILRRHPTAVNDRSERRLRCRSRPTTTFRSPATSRPAASKHFNWEPRGKRRIHKTPGQRAIAACQAWLEREIGALRPAVIVALGGTALAALLGRGFKVGESRGRDDLLHHTGARVLATYHPSAVLRAIDDASRAQLYEALVADLARARHWGAD